MLAALFSALHLLGLGVGLGSIVARARALRAVAAGDAAAVGRVLAADTLWGLAAVLWVGTGLTRLFGALDRSTAFYLHNGYFWIKMALFALVFALEIAPMAAFIGWRIARGKGAAIDTGRAALFARISEAQIVLVVLMPFAAAAMTRGLWLFA